MSGIWARRRCEGRKRENEGEMRLGTPSWDEAERSLFQSASSCLALRLILGSVGTVGKGFWQGAAAGDWLGA